MKKILIIDDDEAIRSTLGLFFRMKNYTCTLANDGEAGLLAFFDEAPDIFSWTIECPSLTE